MTNIIKFPENNAFVTDEELMLSAAAMLPLPTLDEMLARCEQAQEAASLDPDSSDPTALAIAMALDAARWLDAGQVQGRDTLLAAAAMLHIASWNVFRQLPANKRRGLFNFTRKKQKQKRRPASAKG